MPAPLLPIAGEGLSVVIARCLEKNPANRYQSVVELLDDLESPQNIPLEASSDETEDKIAEIWKNASMLFSQGNLNEAAKLTERILDAQPDHSDALRLKEEISRRFVQGEQFYREIEADLEHGDLSELAGAIKEAISIYPDHSAGRLIQARLGVRARRYREVLEEGISALQGECWDSASDYFQQALSLQPTASYLRPIIGFLTKIENHRRDIHEALAQGEYKRGLRLARLVDLIIKEMKRSVPALRGGRDEIS
jgi:tetratricopeptide (TPR) repeat protein